MYVAKHQQNETEGGSSIQQNGLWITDTTRQGTSRVVWRTNTGIVEYYYRYYYYCCTVFNY